MQKSILWAEDLESHRQPSLYYLSEDDDHRIDGPHLICDWNGPPADFDDIDLDTLGLVTFERVPTEDDKQRDDELLNSGDKFMDYPNPAADLVKLDDKGRVSTQAYRQNDLDLAECAHLDFLSVPPITQGLLRHLVRNIQNIKRQQAMESSDSSEVAKEEIVNN